MSAIRDTEIQNLNEALKVFQGKDVDELARKSQLGDLAFTELNEEFEELVGLIQRIDALPFSGLATSIIIGLKIEVERLREAYKAIMSFDVRNQGGHRDEYIRRFITQSKSMLYSLHQAVSLAEVQRIGENAMAKELAHLLETSRGFYNQISQTKESADKVLDSIKALAPEAAISAHSLDFKGASEKYSENSSTWLIWTIFFAFLTVLVLTFSILSPFIFESRISYWSDSMNLSFGLAKFAAFSFAAGITLWCGRNYRANKHLEALNDHRANSLKSLQAFLAAVKDENSKDTLIVEAVKTVYAPSTTGFIHSEDSNTGVTQVVEFFKNKTAG